MDKIKVLLVDDDKDWLITLSHFLEGEEDIILTGFAASAEEALMLIRSEKPDVILMDITMNGSRNAGILATFEILSSIKTKVIMLTCIDEKEIINASFIAGAVNYIYKCNYIEILHAIRSTLRDNPPIETLLEGFLRLNNENMLKDLNSTEKEIFKLIEKGHSRNQIANALSKTESTIKSQIRTILKKLNVKDCKEALLKVRSRGFYNKD